MKQNKTIPTDQKVETFLAKLEDEQRADSETLIDIMSSISGEPAVMWGPSIIGFGSEHYKYDSGREGDMPIIGFSPRKGKFSLYVTYTPEKFADQLDRVGKHSYSKACIYLKNLSSLNVDELHKFIQMCYDDNVSK